VRLSSLSKGASGVVCKLNFDPAQSKLARRLLLMGIRPGVRIEVVGKAPLGDPVVVRVKNQGFGLRKELLELIEVQPCE